MDAKIKHSATQLEKAPAGENFWSGNTPIVS